MAAFELRSGYRLVLYRHVACLLLTVLFAERGRAQDSVRAKRLEFEVASVRQNKSDDKPHSNVSLDSGNVYSTIDNAEEFARTGGYLSAVNQPLWRYIAFAYKLSGTQELALRFNYFSGLGVAKPPFWVTGGFDSRAEGFDISARVDGSATRDQLRLMMQALLEDRFKLVVHRETREAPILALVPVHAGKTGPQLKPHDGDQACSTETPKDVSGPAPVVTSAVGALPIVCGVIAHVPSRSAGSVHFGGRGVGLGLLATSLPTMTGMATLPRPVVNQTGLDGMYDFTLEWTTQPEESGPTFFEALQQQLGLKVIPRKGPVEIFVIDRVEHPSESAN